MFSTKNELKNISDSNNKQANNKSDDDGNTQNDGKPINPNSLEQNVPMKVCGNDSETYYCYNNIVNMGENYMMRLTTLRSCDKNQDKSDKNVYCKYYEECVKPNDSQKK